MTSMRLGPALFVPAEEALERREADSAPRERPPLPEPMVLTAYEFSLATGPLPALELDSERLSPDAVESVFAHSSAIGELAILRTCHRAELYVWARRSFGMAELSACGSIPWERARSHRGEAAVRHLFRVAAGLESIAVGEREVRDQVHDVAGHVVSRYPRPVLRTLFLRAVRTAEASAPHVPLGRSIAALAADRVLEECAHPFLRVLVIGSGTAGREVTERLSMLARVALLYRTHPPEEAFLRLTGARSAAWESLGEELPLSDAVVTAIKDGKRLFGPELVRHRERPLLVVDLGIPRNVDPAVGRLPGIRLVDLEGLRPRVLPRMPEEVEERVEAEARIVSREVATEGFEAWIDAYRRSVEQLRKRVVATSLPSFRDLSPEQERAIEQLTRRLVTRILHVPTARLRSLADHPDDERFRRWAFELLALDPTDRD